MCGHTDRMLLPPYITHKIQHLYNIWTERAPCCNQPYRYIGSWFNDTVSDGISVQTFRDWFVKNFCFMQKMHGCRVRDNLSGTLHEMITKLFTENNVDFVCLLSRYICQHPYMAFSIQCTSWRQVLTNSKNKKCQIDNWSKGNISVSLGKNLAIMTQVQPKTNL